MDIIIFSGQSNMQGQSECLTENAVVENAWEYKFLSDEAVPLKDPVGENITYDLKAGWGADKKTVASQWLGAHVTGASCYKHTNMVPSFCRVYTQLTGQNVLAVHIAKGSTVIKDWLPNSKGYDILVRKSLAAIKKAASQEKINHIFFVWLQGESDAIEGNSKEYYKQKITQLCSALKEDIGIHKFGMIRVGRFTNDERDWEIISAQDEVCIENSDFLMLTDIAVELNAQPEYMNPFVRGHYSAKGLEKLGSEAAKTLANYAKNSGL